MPANDLFTALDAWVALRWLRPLDRAFVRFLHDEGGEREPRVLLAAALASHQLGRGHPALDLAATQADPAGALSLPPPELALPEPAPPLPDYWLTGLAAADWAGLLAASAVAGPPAEDGNSPLVLAGGRLYLRRYWRYERQVADGIRRRLAQRLEVPADLAGRLDSLFGGLRDAGEVAKTTVHWQSIAAAMAARSAFTVISGGPGTGKTTTVVRLLGLLQALALERPAGRPLAIRLAAPTGKAAARLTESIGRAVGSLPLEAPVKAAIPTEVATLHRLLGARPDTRRFVHHAGNPLALDVLVIDEASMVDLEMMASVLAALPPQARLILLGDKDQLASVEAGAVLGSLCAGTVGADAPAAAMACSAGLAGWLRQASGYAVAPADSAAPVLADHVAVLKTSHRFGAESGIGRLARAVNAGDMAQVEEVWRDALPDMAWLTLQAEADRQLDRLARDSYRPYLRLARQGAGVLEPDDWARSVLEAFGTFRLLCALRRGAWGVEGLNLRIAAVLGADGLIDGHAGEWYPGRPVMVTHNDYALGLMNGDIGIALPDATGRLRVAFMLADGGIKWVLPSRLADAETVYAMTVHKSQGSEFDHAVLVLPERNNPVLGRELVYTGITRAKRRFTLATPTPAVLAWAVGQRTLRSSGLAEALTAD